MNDGMQSASLGAAMRAQCRRDLLLVFRHPQELLNPIFFLVMVVSLFPLAVTPEPAQLAKIAPGVLWVAALLAVLVSLDHLFRTDAEDGALELMLLSPQALFFLCLTRALSHWVAVVLPLALCAPLLGALLNLSPAGMWASFLALLLGTPQLCLVGAIGAALLAGLRRGGVLLFLLVLPLFVPVLVFGAGAVLAAEQGLPYGGHLALLGAMLAMGFGLAPFAISAALRVALS